MNKKFESIKQEVRLAYADSWMPWEKGEAARNLSYRSNEWLSIDEAADIFAGLEKDFEYNEFKPGLLYKLPKDTAIQIAREGSVAIYFATKTKLDNHGNALRKRLKADELAEDGYDNAGNVIYRVWWD